MSPQRWLNMMVHLALFVCLLLVESLCASPPMMWDGNTAQERARKVTKWLRSSVCEKTWNRETCRDAHKKIEVAYIPDQPQHTSGLSTTMPASRDGYFGVVVSPGKHVRKEDVVFIVPFEYILSGNLHSVARRYHAVHGLLSLLARLPNQRSILAALLYLELWIRGLRSDLAPWLAMLPKDTLAAFTWDKVMRDVLLLPAQNVKMQQARQEARQEYEALKRLWPDLLHVFEQAFSGTHQEERDSQLRWRRFLRVFALIESRAWSVNGNRYLVPGADMFNHAKDDEDVAFRPPQHPRKMNQYYPRSQKFLTRHIVHDSWIEVRSDRDASFSDVELYESYGDNESSTYFEYFGFVPHAVNPYDCVYVLGHCIFRDQVWEYRYPTCAMVSKKLTELTLELESFLQQLNATSATDIMAKRKTKPKNLRAFEACFHSRKTLSLMYHTKLLQLHRDVSGKINCRAQSSSTLGNQENTEL